MKNGFISISVLVVVLVGIIVAGGTGYVVVKQLQQTDKGEQRLLAQEDLDVDEKDEIQKLREELDMLKEQQQKEQNQEKQVVIQQPQIIERAIEQPQVNNITNAPGVKIEICKAEAKKEVAKLRDKALETLVDNFPGLISLAKAQNNQETENAALKYGFIKQSDVVRSQDVFQELLNEGIDINTAGKVAEAAGKEYWTYIENLHKWAFKEVEKMVTLLEGSLEKDENDIYLECLSRL